MHDTERPQGRSLALHACCGPCLIEPLDALKQEFDRIVIVFANPNIHPADEYQRRLATLEEYAQNAGVEVVELPSDPREWIAAAGPVALDAAARCRACYRVRLGAVAMWAAEHGYDSIATTLTVSPYQNHTAIAEEGRRAAVEAGVAYVERDFRDRYSEATRRSRELGMYRQRYCGCIAGEYEQRAERERRRRGPD